MGDDDDDAAGDLAATAEALGKSLIHLHFDPLTSLPKQTCDVCLSQHFLMLL